MTTIATVVIYQPTNETPLAATCGKGLQYETKKAFLECFSNGKIVAQIPLEGEFDSSSSEEKVWELLQSLEAMGFDLDCYVGDLIARFVMTGYNYGFGRGFAEGRKAALQELKSKKAA